MKHNKGFTLIEIMTVVLIIGVLSAVALPQYRRVMQKSYATQAIAMLRSINDSSERLAVEFGYKSFANLYESAPTKAKFSRMDMFSPENLPSSCQLSDSDYTLTCPTNDQLKAFSYKAHYSVGAGASKKNYIVAKKVAEPYKDTYILFNREDSSLSCKPVNSQSPACDVFGLNETSVNVSF